MLAALATGACSTLNKNECLTVDWRAIGYEDGVAGRSGDRVAQHRKACAKHGVSLDLALYQGGRDEGLREFCQPANGFRLGANGYTYTGLCPGDLEPAFVGSYESGRGLYMLQTRVSNAASQIEAKHRELELLEEQIIKHDALIVRSESSEQERAQALVQAKQLAERAGKLKVEIRQLQDDKVHYERDLADYRANLASGVE